MKAVGRGMCCPKCESVATDVVDSRPSGSTIRRRRRCRGCSHRWTTFEITTEGIDAVDFYEAQRLRGELDSLPPATCRAIASLILLLARRATVDTALREQADEMLIEM